MAKVHPKRIASKKALLIAEERLVFGTRLSAVIAARDELRALSDWGR
jgi:hypothetical protein